MRLDWTRQEKTQWGFRYPASKLSQGPAHAFARPSQARPPTASLCSKPRASTIKPRLRLDPLAMARAGKTQPILRQVPLPDAARETNIRAFTTARRAQRRQPPAPEPEAGPPWRVALSGECFFFLLVC